MQHVPRSRRPLRTALAAFMGLTTAILMTSCADGREGGRGDNRRETVHYRNNHPGIGHAYGNRDRDERRWGHNDDRRRLERIMIRERLHERDRHERRDRDRDRSIGHPGVLDLILPHRFN